MAVCFGVDSCVRVYFPQYLQKAGYATAFVGKWHMGSASDEPRPGFDRWVSFRGQGHYLPPGPNYTLNVDGKRVRQRGYVTDIEMRIELNKLAFYARKG